MSRMIPDLEGYFRQFVPPRDPLLFELEEEARQEGVPIVGPDVGELLYTVDSGVTHLRACQEKK